MVSCAMDLPYPACVNGTSLLTTVVWIAGSLCYEAGYRPGCTMPATNVSAEAGLRPVYIPPGRTLSTLRSEVVFNGKAGAPVPAGATVHVNTTGGTLTVTAAATTVVAARSGVFLDALHIAAPNVAVDGVPVGTLTMQPGLEPGALRLANLTLGNPLSLVPTPQQHTLGLDGARFSAISGAAIALFRHRGTVTCAGATTRCFVIQRADAALRQGTTVAADGAAVVDVSSITGVFGQDYLVSFFAFDQDEETTEAARLASSLVLPTVIALVSIWLSHGPHVSGDIGAAQRALRQTAAAQKLGQWSAAATQTRAAPAAPPQSQSQWRQRPGAR